METKSLPGNHRRRHGMQRLLRTFCIATLAICAAAPATAQWLPPYARGYAPPPPLWHPAARYGAPQVFHRPWGPPPRYRGYAWPYPPNTDPAWHFRGGLNRWGDWWFVFRWRGDPWRLLGGHYEPLPYTWPSPGTGTRYPFDPNGFDFGDEAPFTED